MIICLFIGLQFLSWFFYQQKLTQLRHSTSINTYPNNHSSIKYQHNVDYFLGTNISSGTTIEELLSRLGTPEIHQIKPFINIYNPKQTDEIHELIYDGIYIRAYRIPLENKDIILSIQLLSNKIKLPYNIAINSPIDKIYGVFGMPKTSISNRITYEGSLYPGSYISFTFNNNKTLKQIEWAFILN